MRFVKKCALQPTPEEPIPIDKPQGILHRRSPSIRHTSRTSEEVSLCQSTRKSANDIQIMEVISVTHKLCLQKMSRSL
ncbi:unnamed protein product [Prunus armeniaca]